MPRTKGHVLIADADQDTRELVQCFLGHAGYGVTGAATVGESLELVKQRNFDMVLLDWRFEDGTGYELCRQIRAMGGCMPILFCTGNSVPCELKKALDAGAQGYFVKPIDMDRLKYSITNM